MKAALISFCALAAAPAATAQSAPFADFFKVDDRPVLLATATPQAYAGLYSQPGGGRLLSEHYTDETGRLQLPLSGGSIPAFVLLRDKTGSGAHVFPLETPEFELKSPQLVHRDGANTVTWTCAGRKSAPLAVEIWRRLPGRLPERQEVFEPSSSEQTYSDPFPAIGVSYQLRVVAGDGAARWQSEPMTRIAAVWVYPNPAGKHIQLQFDGMADNLQVQVRDVQGRVALQMPYSAAGQKITIESLRPGTYTIQLSSGEEVIGAGTWVKQ